MAKRTKMQNIGSFGQRLVALIIERNGNWVARNQDEDFGIDLEAELSEPIVNGDIIKIQIKCQKKIEIIDNSIKVRIDKKYLYYAFNCRIPIIYVIVDQASEQAWYIWLQEVVFDGLIKDGKFQNKDVVKIICESETLENGLHGKIKEIATMQTKIQLELALLDIVKSVTSYNKSKYMSDFYKIFIKMGNIIGLEISIDYIIDKLVEITGKENANFERNEVQSTLYDLCWKFGCKFTKQQIIKMTIHEKGYPHMGINALGILYSGYFHNILKFELPKYYKENNHMNLWYFSSLHEKYPDMDIMSIVSSKSINLIIDDYTIEDDDREYICDKFINRGCSVFLQVPLKKIINGI